MTSLYNLSIDARQLQELLDADAEEHDGVLDDLSPELTDAIDRSCSDIGTKVDRIVSLIHEYDARSGARLKAARELMAASRTDDSKSGVLRAYLGQCMALAGAKQWSGTIHEARVCRNGGKTPVVIKTSIADLPMRFQEVVVEADVDAIRAALEAGESITGCELAARGTHVRIK